MEICIHIYIYKICIHIYTISRYTNSYIFRCDQNLTRNMFRKKTLNNLNMDNKVIPIIKE